MFYNKLKCLFVLMVTVVCCTSCDPASKYEEQISEIDSCFLVLENIEEKYNGIEFDSLAYMVEHVLQNEDTIQKYYRPDTVSLEIGIRMNDCKGVRKTMKGVMSKKESYKVEISALQNQLDDLRTDILNGVLKEEQIKEYIDREKNDLNVFSRRFNEFYDLQKKESNYFYASCPIIDSFIVKLKNEANQE